MARNLPVVRYAGEFGVTCIGALAPGRRLNSPPPRGGGKFDALIPREQRISPMR